MRKIYLLMLPALLSGMTVTARSLSPSEALGRVAGDMQLRQSRGTVAPVMTVGTAGAPALYVFNRPEGGWMIVSADDVAAPVIGFSDSGAIDPENLPENFRGWLEQSSGQIRTASVSGAEAYTVSRTTDREPIAQMVKTAWDQTTPYSDYCPVVNNRRTYTGCVATAMAQVMKYYNWPEQAGANASFSYTWRGGPASTPTLSADFSNFKFDWAHMLDSYRDEYTEVQSDAVSKLMQACGYSVEMMYSTVASAAFNEKVGYGLVTYFNYDEGLHNEPRELYSSDEWEAMVYDNLKNVGPMVYWGSGNVGHCFVCDGYRGDGYFHFNWGWSGNSDGYFLLDALNPAYVGAGGGAGGYNNAQGALFGAKPASGTPSERRYTFTCSGFNKVTAQGTYLTIEGEFKNRSPYIVDGTPVYIIYNEGGSELLKSIVVTSPNFSDFSSDLDRTRLSGSIPSAELGEGTYRVYPGIRVGNKDYIFRTPASEPDYVIYTRTKNGSSYTNTATLPSVGEKVIDNLDTNGDFYMGSNIKISGIGRFTGDAETSLYVLAALIDADGNVLTTAEGTTVRFTPEGTPFEFVSTWFDTRNYTIEAGAHTFALVYMDNATYDYKVIASCPVTISPYADGSYNIASLEVSNSTAVDPKAIQMTGTVEGLGGVAWEDLYFAIQNAAGETVVEQPVALYVAAGRTVTLTATLSLPNAVPGEVYKAYFYKKRFNWMLWQGMGPVYELDPVPFTIGDLSGIADIETDEQAPAEYFNLQGVRVDSENLTPGIYIRRQGSKTAKVLIR